MKSRNTITLNVVVLASALLTLVSFTAACGKKSSDEQAPVTEQKQNPQNLDDKGAKGNGSSQNGGNQTTSPTTNSAANSGAEDQTILGKVQLIQHRVVNGSVKESYAFFAISPKMQNLEILDVTLDGQSLSTAMTGFGWAKIAKGKLDAQVVKSMFNGENGLNNEEKAQLVEQYKGALYLYSEGHSFDFTEEGKAHRVKILFGKGSNKTGEYEFVLENKKEG